MTFLVLKPRGVRRSVPILDTPKVLIPGPWPLPIFELCFHHIQRLCCMRMYFCFVF